MSRTYSDPSYGSKKNFKFTILTAGTRATVAPLDSFEPMTSITVLDWNIINTTLGTGGTSQWTLTATSSDGTSAIGTIAMAGTHAVGAVVDGAATETNVPAGGVIHLNSVLSTAADLTIEAVISYTEDFDVSDS